MPPGGGYPAPGTPGFGSVAPAAKGLALTALILGIAAFLAGLVPVLGMIIGLVAIIFAIFALVKKQSKAFAITGGALGAVGMVVSLIATLLLGGMALGAAEALKEETDVTVQSPESDNGKDSEAPSETAGTRENPVAIGTTISGKEYEVVVNSVTRDATEQVLAANSFNKAPAEGNEYLVVNLTITYTGADSGFDAMVRSEYVSAEGKVFDGLATIAVAPEPALQLEELYTGASTTGNRVLQVPSGDAGLLRISPGILANEVFVALQ